MEVDQEENIHMDMIMDQKVEIHMDMIMDQEVEMIQLDVVLDQE